MDRRPLANVTNQDRTVLKWTKIVQLSKPVNNLKVHTPQIHQQFPNQQVSSYDCNPASILVPQINSTIKPAAILARTSSVTSLNSSATSKIVPLGQLKTKSLSLNKEIQLKKNKPDLILTDARKIASNLLTQNPASIHVSQINSTNKPAAVLARTSTSTTSFDTSATCNIVPVLLDQLVTHVEGIPTTDCDLFLNNSDLSDWSDDFDSTRRHSTKSKNKVTESGGGNEVTRKKAGCRKKPDEIAKTVEKAREESLGNPAFEKVHENLPSFTPDYVVIKTSSEPNPFHETEEHWSATIRVNITDKLGAYQWLSDFEKKSSCDFRVKKTKKENSARLVFKKEYQCHHNTRPRERPTKSTTSSRKTNVRTSKNTFCPSIVRITIKQRSMEWSSDDLLKDYPCEIFISHRHNHPIDSADALRHRRPTDEVKQKFLKMFADGHTVLSAIETYKFDLMLEYGADYLYAAADGSKCPSNYWLYKLFRKVSISHYGPQSGEGMVESLKDFCSKYNTEVGDQCMKVDIRDGRDLIVAICTPMMKRTHELLRSAGEMMFVDSSGTMDVLNCRVFLLLTPSVAGALPLGILVVSSESEDVLKPAIDVLKSLLPCKAFYGRGPDIGPKIAMTDDCSSERNSLKRAFPGIILLLCLFHVLQAFWRYVWKRENDVPEKHRPEIFYVMKDLAYAKDQSTFLDLVEDAKQNPLLLSNKKISDHIMKYVQRSDEWALFQREDLLTRGNDTNNYSEATMRIIKDKVLGRVKAFNPVQLVDFLITRFQSYIEMRITDVLNNRSVNPSKSRYFIRPQKLENLVTEKLPHPPNCYKVTNRSKATTYIVLMEYEICSCPEGKSGKPCKHQCAVVKNFKLSSAQFLPREQTGIEMKLTLFEIIHGHREVPSGWFNGLHDYVENNTITAVALSSTASSPTETSSQEVSSPSPAPSPDSLDLDLVSTFSEDVLAAEEKLKEMFSGWLQNLKRRPDSFLDPVNAMLNANTKIKDSDSGLISAFMNFGKSVGPLPLSVKKRTQSTIPVQPTAKGRRTMKAKGCRAQTGGRPLKASMPPKGEERNYPGAIKRKSTEPHWARLPKKKYPAAHSLQLCVSSNRMIGGNHSKKS